MKIIALLIFLPLLSFGGTTSVTLENDIIGGTDGNYTHGTRISQQVDSYFGWSPKLFEDRYTDYHVILAQYMFTPSDIEVETLIEDDRPYGGWLYLGFLLEERTANELDILEFDIGMVGPSSFSEETQKYIHEKIDGPEPLGWDNQIKDEFGVGLIYQKKYRFRKDTWFDIIPHGGGSVGNIFTYANVGCMFRIGYNLPDDFGKTGMEPTIRFFQDVGTYFFVDLDGRYVLRNIFLDGNTFRNSHSVDKEPLVGDIKLGLSFYYKSFGVVYSYNIRSKEFKNQEDNSEFGTLIFSWGI